MKEIAVKFLPETTPLGIRLITSVHGIDSVQATHLMSIVGGIEQEHIIVNPYPVKPDRTKCLAIAEEIQLAYPSAIISVLLDDSPGAAAVFALQDTDKSSGNIAAAATCVKAVWGWDESTMFEIRVNNQTVSLRVVAIDGEGWSRFTI